MFGRAPEEWTVTLDDLSVTNVIVIEASIEEVWTALTTPDLIKRWFLGVDTMTDWKVGSSLVHTGAYQGKPYVDKGEILRFEPPRLLVHTHWSDLSGKPDEPENYQQVTWGLVERGEATELTLTERNLPSEEAKVVSEQSWKTVLRNLKDLLEGRPSR